MPSLRELKAEDFKNHNLPDDCTRFDVLLAVVERASSLYDESNKKEKDSDCNSSCLLKRKVCSSTEKKDEAFCFPRAKARRVNRQDGKVVVVVSQPIKERQLPIAETDQENNQEVVLIKNKRNQQQANNNLINYISPLEILIHQPVLIDQLPIEYKESLASYNQGLIIEKEILVIQKALTATDITPHQGRLSIPSNHIKNKFLNDDEIMILASREENGKNMKKLVVNMIDPMRMKWEVAFRRWVMNKDSKKKKKEVSQQRLTTGGASVSYVINKPWPEIVYSNKLKQGDIVQLWGVRVLGSLWFVLLKLNPRT